MISGIDGQECYFIRSVVLLSLRRGQLLDPKDYAFAKAVSLPVHRVAAVQQTA